MGTFRKIRPEEFDSSPFKIIGKDWMLIAAESQGRVNCMTASWGGLGVMWSKNIAFIVVRKSRFTKELIDASESFSLNFFDRSQHGAMLSYMGTVSGRDEDKIARQGMALEHQDNTPYFSQASTVILCRKLSCHPLDPSGFLDSTIDGQWYPDRDYHDLYMGEVVSILAR